MKNAPKGLVDRNRKHNPDSPKVSHWPFIHEADAGNATTFGDAVSPAVSPLAPQTPGISVVAATLADSCFIPPVISESHDGIHFSAPAAISFHPAADSIIDSRPVIAALPGAGLYIGWDNLSTLTGRYSIKAAQSAQNGPFGPPTDVVTDSLVSSATVTASPNKLYIGWDEWGFNSSFPYTTGGRLMMATSPTGGDFLFSEPQELAQTNIGFSRRIAAMPELGASPDLTLIADPNKTDLVHAVFADAGNGIDIFYMDSRDAGRTWQRPVMVNDDRTTADQFDPAIAVDSSGNLNVAFYDTRLSPSSRAADVFVARSPDGSNFAPNQRITTQTSDDSMANPSRDYTANLGDRISVGAITDNVIVVWTDTRLGSEDIFLSIIGNQ